MGSRSILLLRSLCDQSENISYDEQEDNGHHINKDVDQKFAWQQLLETTPVVCKLRLLPEIPPINENKGNSNSDTSNTKFSFRERRKAAEAHHHQQGLQIDSLSLNPCGTDNVLLLTNLPTASSQDFLLSITSCRFVFNDEERHEQTEMNSSWTRTLPIDAVPSTFSFSFLPQNESDHSFYVPPSMDDATSSSPTEGSSSFAEVLVVFDVTEAHRSFQEYHGKKQQHKDDVGGNESNATRTAPISTLDESITGETDFDDAKCSAHKEGSVSQEEKTTRSRQEDLLLQELRFLAKREEEFINMVLKGLGGLGIVLLVAFAWVVQRVWRKVQIQHGNDMSTQEGINESQAGTASTSRICASESQMSQGAVLSDEKPDGKMKITIANADQDFLKSLAVVAAGKAGVAPMDPCCAQNTLSPASVEGTKPEAIIPLKISAHREKKLGSGSAEEIATVKSGEALPVGLSAFQKQLQSARLRHSSSSRLYVPKATSSNHSQPSDNFTDKEGGTEISENHNSFVDRPIESETTPRSKSIRFSYDSNKNCCSPERPKKPADKNCDTGRELSPCSKLAKEWEESKNLRRKNKRNHGIKPHRLVPAPPIVQVSVDIDERTQSRGTSSDPTQLFSPFSSMPPQETKKMTENGVEQQKKEKTKTKSLYISPFISTVDSPASTSKDLAPSPASTTVSHDDSFLQDFWQ